MGSYSWQADTNTRLPGSAVFVAHQFLRCVLHQLAPNNVFLQIFLLRTPEKHRAMFFKSIAQAFVDFNELYPCGPLQLVVEHLNSKKTLPIDQMSVIAGNMAMYLECLAPEALGPVTACAPLLQQLEALLRAVALQPHQLEDGAALLRACAQALRLPAAPHAKSILEPISKIISYSVQNFVVKLSILCELSVVCMRAFTRDRDKLLVCRVLVYELVQALRTKNTIPDDNLFILMQYVLQGHGCTLVLPPQLNTGDLLAAGPDARELGGGAVDCMRPHLPDMIELLQDPNLLNKIKGQVSKSIVNRNLICLNEDTLGAIVKGGIAQYVAMELALEGSRSRTERPHRHPWLLPAPPQYVPQPQRAPLCSQPRPHHNPWLLYCNIVKRASLCHASKECAIATAWVSRRCRDVAECVGRVRLVSWLVAGALCNARDNRPLQQPVPQDASCHITDHLQSIMASYAEQWKPCSQRMSALFHAFVLCQLWTLYLERLAGGSAPSTEPHYTALCVLLEFWCKLVPSVLQVAAHSKLLAETINLHFLSLLESLLECNSTVLNKLLPLWTPILHSPLFTTLTQQIEARGLQPPAARRHNTPLVTVESDPFVLIRRQ
ncbi:hypothetical protein ACJJTC_016971 [Scirpophaga incertulas]